MQYRILIYGDEKESEKMTGEERNQDFGRWMQYTKDLGGAGVLRAARPCSPSARPPPSGCGTARSATATGPFAETKEQLGGFYPIDVPDLDQALAWAAKCPGAAYGSIEVRPIMLIPKD